MSSRSFFVFRGSLITLALVACLASSAWAQRTDYSKGKSQFPNPIAPYQARTVPPPNFSNSPRIDQLIKNGKLMLSLDDAITLALENNLDLAIARYNLDIADTDILRTKSGAAARGVATGIVSGTPGGGVNGFGTGASGASAGGTSSAAGGAGTGTGGLVTSTTGVGPTVPSFDPFLSGTLQIEHSVTPLSNTVTAGVANLLQNTGTANFAYNQGFATGTNMSVGFNNSRLTTNSIRTNLNPVLNSSFRLTVSQHLLQGFGIAPNLRFIRMAKNSREIADVAFRGQVISTVTQIQNIYWDLVNAYEDVRVKERSLGLANQLLTDTQKQVQIGTLAPIEVVRSQSAVASARQDLIISQTALQLQQLLTKNALARNLQDPVLAAAVVIPTDTMSMPSAEPVTPIQDMESDALSHRWELAQSRIDLTNRDINKKAARSALLPTLDLFGFYGASALGGLQNPLLGLPAGSIPTVGYGSTFGGLFDSTAPDKGVGLSLTIPIRNRSAQADQVRSELEYSQAQMRLQQLQNQIRIEVRNAQYALEQNRARVDAAQAGAKLAAESLDAEQKKYLLGASTNYNVLQSQRDLTQAESNLVAARAAYEKSRVEVDRATGLTLTRLGIDIADAETAQVKKPPTVPGVIPRSQNPQAPPITPQPPGPTGQPLPPSPTGPVGQPPAPSTPPQTSVPPELK
ncbi:MAG: TolC family protein [Acidobacteriia bacterium]|nr:TolC family protein [Terriglobia bacterium]